MSSFQSVRLPLCYVSITPIFFLLHTKSTSDFSSCRHRSRIHQPHASVFIAISMQYACGMKYGFTSSGIFFQLENHSILRNAEVSSYVPDIAVVQQSASQSVSSLRVSMHCSYIHSENFFRIPCSDNAVFRSHSARSSQDRRLRSADI